MAASDAFSIEIDRLLAQYLDLLDEYQTLRASLTKQHSSIQQNIARANFEAQRGVRYGEDHYDARMHATRLCGVTVHPESANVEFTISGAGKLEPASDASELQGEGAANGEGKEKGTGSEADSDEQGEDVDSEAPAAPTEEEKVPEKPKTKDPIRMFGILVPRPLRMAQQESVVMVEEIIPRLVTIDAEMAQVEIKIRRARKYRGKAEAAEREKMGAGETMVKESRREELAMN